MAGTISKGIKLSYKTGSTGTTYTDLTNLMEIPALGNGDKDSVEVTVLSDSAHTYIDGLDNYGDSIEFKFLYEKAQFDTLFGFGDTVKDWKVTLPGTSSGICSFSGSCGVSLDGVGTNAALTYTLKIRPNSALVWA